MNTRLGIVVIAAGWSLLALLAVGCVAPGRARVVAEAPPPGLSTEVLGSRAERVWRARQAEDWAVVFDFESPARRALTTRAEYAAQQAQRAPLKVHEFEVLRVQCDPDLGLGWVELEVANSARGFPGAPVQRLKRWEVWQAIDGTWYPVAGRGQENYPAAPVLRDAAEEVRLTARCDQFWRARRAGDWEALFAFSDPRDRDRVDEAEWRAHEERWQHLARDVHWVEVVGDRGRVRVTYTVKPDDPSLTKYPPEDKELIERWIRRDGAWYRELAADPWPQNESES